MKLEAYNRELHASTLPNESTAVAREASQNAKPQTIKRMQFFGRRTHPTIPNTAVPISDLWMTFDETSV